LNSVFDIAESQWTKKTCIVIGFPNEQAGAVLPVRDRPSLFSEEGLRFVLFFLRGYGSMSNIQKSNTGRTKPAVFTLVNNLSIMLTMGYMEISRKTGGPRFVLIAGFVRELHKLRCQIVLSRAAATKNKLYFLLTVARRTPESSMVRKNSVSTPAIFTRPAPTEQISTIAVKIEQKIVSYDYLHQ